MASYLNGERRAHKANNNDDKEEQERNGIQKEWGGNERPETHIAEVLCELMVNT